MTAFPSALKGFSFQFNIPHSGEAANTLAYWFVAEVYTQHGYF